MASLQLSRMQLHCEARHRSLLHSFAGGGCSRSVHTPGASALCACVRRARACGGAAEKVQAGAPPMSNAIHVCQRQNQASEEWARMSVFGSTANETPWHASSSQASVFCSAAQRAPGRAGRPPDYVCKWAAIAQVLSGCLTTLHVQPAFFCPYSARHKSARHIDTCCMVWVRRRCAHGPLRAGRGPCTARLQALLFHGVTAAWGEHAWPGCLGGVAGPGRMMPWRASVCLCASTLVVHVAACGSWQAVAECGWMSICCPLRVQPANLISLVSILFFVLLCQVLVCQSQKELKVSALPACTHARIRAVP